MARALGCALFLLASGQAAEVLPVRPQGVPKPPAVSSAASSQWSSNQDEAGDRSPGRYWSGDPRLDQGSLFASSRLGRDARRFVGETLLDGEDVPTLMQRMGARPTDAALAAQTLQKALDEATVDLNPASSTDKTDDAISSPRLQPGTIVRLKLDERGLSLFELAGGGPHQPLEEVEVLATPTLLVSLLRSGDGYTYKTRKVALEKRYVAIAGEISRSLSIAVRRAGLPASLLTQFADVFAFDVDFAREVYRGDRFEVVYEMLYDQDGHAIAPGQVVFAGLSWRGGTQSKNYYRFADGQEGRVGYYSHEGENPRTLLMKTPINGARVTSRFGRRRHPVLGYAAGHKGVDFGAPPGTPVLAAGDGTVSIAGPRGTFGNYIRIDHQGDYQTAYAHLRGFAPGMTIGRRVRQGEVIGYVGTTGRSTGPHLHYEVRYRGEPQDPQTAKVAVGETLTGDPLARFVNQRERVDSLRIRPFAVVEATLP